MVLFNGGFYWCFAGVALPAMQVVGNKWRVKIARLQEGKAGSISARAAQDFSGHNDLIHLV